MIKILFVERNIILSNYYKEVFSQNKDIQLVRIFTEGDDVLEFLDTNSIDVVVIDYMQTNGLVTTAKINNAHPTVTIIGFSCYDKGSYIDRMIELGAKSCLSKYNTTINMLINHIITCYSIN